MKKLFVIAFTLLNGTGFISCLHAQDFKVQKYGIGGEGGTDYLTAEPGTGRVFISRGSHVMVVDGNNGTVIGDIPQTPRTHGIALVAKYNHGFTTNGGDSTVSMFDLKTLTVLKKIKIPAGGLDGIMYDDFWSGYNYGNSPGNLDQDLNQQPREYVKFSPSTQQEAQS